MRQYVQKLRSVVTAPQVFDSSALVSPTKRTQRLLPPRGALDSGAAASGGLHFHPYTPPAECVFELAFGKVDLDEDQLTEVPDDETVRGEQDDESRWDFEGSEQGDDASVASQATNMRMVDDTPRFKALHDAPTDRNPVMMRFFNGVGATPDIWQPGSAEEQILNSQTTSSSPTLVATSVPNTPGALKDLATTFGNGQVPRYDGNAFFADDVSMRSRWVPSEFDYPDTIDAGSDCTMETWRTETVIMDDVSETDSDVTMKSGSSFHLSDADSESDAYSEMTDHTVISEYGDVVYTPRRSIRLLYKAQNWKMA